ncbi:guanine nucleotide-binding protein subunit beta-like protein [Aplysia californica]|uniref:Guanine nucleotide-binding protein subunit beta-like protein n=1 Tax=Aplysia californica TaxID=6500 RepID=A0ABM1A3V4_APLCA|nr:guanine nucleotide-binding protein subunit beta-like protein [Aplysia californica]
MARRILEQEMLAAEGITLDPLGPAQSLEVVKEIKLHKTFNGVFSVQFNHTGSLLAVGFGSGGVQLFDPLTGTMTKELRACRQGGSSVMTLRFHPKEPDVLYAGTTEGYVYIYNVKTGEQLGTIEELGNEINTLDFCVDGFNFATGGKDLNVRVYETKHNKLLRTYEGYNEKTFVTEKNKVANTMRVFSIKFHPNNQYIFVSGGWDNHIKIWDTRDNEGIKRNIRGPHICGDSIDMKDNNILTGQWTALHALQLYDYTSGKVVKEINYPHKDGAFLYAASYVNDNTVMGGGSGTNSLEVVEIDTNRHVGGYKLAGPVQAADSANNGRIIAVGGAAPLFTILKLKD